MNIRDEILAFLQSHHQKDTSRQSVASNTALKERLFFEFGAWRQSRYNADLIFECKEFKPFFSSPLAIPKPSIDNKLYLHGLFDLFLSLHDKTALERQQVLQSITQIIAENAGIPPDFFKKQQPNILIQCLGSRSLGAWSQIVASSALAMASVHCRLSNTTNSEAMDLCSSSVDCVPVLLLFSSSSINNLEKKLIFSSIWLAQRSRILLRFNMASYWGGLSSSNERALYSELQLPWAEQEWLLHFVHDSLFLGTLACCAFTFSFSMALKLPIIAMSFLNVAALAQKSISGLDASCSIQTLQQRYYTMKERLDKKNPIYSQICPLWNEYIPRGLDHVLNTKLDCQKGLSNPMFGRQLAQHVLFNRTLCNTYAASRGFNFLNVFLAMAAAEVQDIPSFISDTPQLRDMFYWLTGKAKVWASQDDSTRTEFLHQNIILDMKSLHSAYGSILTHWNQINHTVQQLKPSVANLYKHMAASPGQLLMPDISSVQDSETAAALNKMDAELAMAARVKRGFLVRYTLGLPFPSDWSTKSLWFHNAHAFIEAIDYDTLIPSILDSNIQTLFRMVPPLFFESSLVLHADLSDQLFLALYASLNPTLWSSVESFVQAHIIEKTKKSVIRYKENDPKLMSLNFLADPNYEYGSIYKMLTIAAQIAPGMAIKAVQYWIPSIENIFLETEFSHHIKASMDREGLFDMLLSKIKFHACTEAKIIDFIQTYLIEDKLSSYEFSHSSSTSNALLKAPIKTVVAQITFLMRLFPNLFQVSAQHQSSWIKSLLNINDQTEQQLHSIEPRGSTYWTLKIYPYIDRISNSPLQYVEILLPWSKQRIYETVWEWEWLDAKQKQQSIIKQFYVTNKSTFLSRFVYILTETLLWSTEEHDNEALSVLLKIASSLKKYSDSKYDMEGDLENALNFFAEFVAKPFISHKTSETAQLLKREMAQTLLWIQAFDHKRNSFALVKPSRYIALAES